MGRNLSPLLDVIAMMKAPTTRYPMAAETLKLNHPVCVVVSSSHQVYIWESDGIRFVEMDHDMIIKLCN